MIGITLGDPNGIGPEILLKSFQKGLLTGKWIVIGDLEVIEFCQEELNMDIPVNRIEKIDQWKDGYLNMLDQGILTKSDIHIGLVSEKSGKASLKYVKKGTLMALSGEIGALVTLPVNKEAIRFTKPGFAGHTGYIAEICNANHHTMMLVSDRISVTHVSTHVPLMEAIQLVKKERIIEVIELTATALKKMGRNGRIAVAALNPHAGEHGAFGKEDQEEITPAIEQARKNGLKVAGPVPADNVFHKTYHGEFDAVVCMFHDQGHIPVKLVAFDSAVNVTLGLPIVRTSVDHGTAFDIAYQGKASINSFINAFDLARQLM